MDFFDYLLARATILVWIVILVLCAILVAEHLTGKDIDGDGRVGAFTPLEKRRERFDG